MRQAILQSEAAECGLASLAMVAGHHGLELSLPELRQRFPLSLKGAKLAQLIHIAQALGFKTRALRLDMDDLDKLALPCVLHWDLNHFVVLQKVSGRKLVILDPAIGKRVLTLEEVSEHFTGVALELAPGETFAPRKAVPSISVRQLTGKITGLWRALAQILLLSIALQVFVVLAPFFMQWVVDQVLVSADRDLLTVLGLGFNSASQLVFGIERMFLDEATSHLDIHNEQWVNAAVKQLDITRVIVAHRPETIASADRVLVLHGGKIVQSIDNRARQAATGVEGNQ
ncbi:hypothetical protein CO614_06400 [Lysobacteraceae bacterium NML120232]|nr:hypothetical protein CO614_06400 [Xanthomonadaceae bacterium NML120232]